MASAIILLPLYIAYLPTDVYGALSMYLAFSLIVQIVVTYSFDTSLFIHYHEFKDEPQKLSVFVSSAFIFMLLLSLAVGLVLVVAGDLIFRLIFDDQKISFYPYGLFAIAAGIFQGLFKIYSNLIQSRQRADLYFWANLILFSGIAGFTVLGLHYFPNTLFGPLGGRALAGLLASTWVLYRVFKEYGFTFNFTLLKATLHFNHYTFIYQIQQWGVTYLDRFLMFFYLPLSSVGIYDFSIKCLALIEFVMMGLNSSFYPKVVSIIMAQKTKESTPELNRYYHGIIAVIMISVCTSIFFLPFIIDLLETDKGYAAAIIYFPYIAASYLIRVVRLYFASPYAVLKYTKPLPGVYTIITIVRIGLILLLVKEFGITGIIISMLVSLVLEVVLLEYVIRKKFTFRYNTFKIIVAPLLLFLAIIILEPLFGADFPVITHLFYIVVVLGFLLWVYRNEIKLLKLKRE